MAEAHRHLAAAAVAVRRVVRVARVRIIVHRLAEVRRQPQQQTQVLLNQQRR